MDVEKGEMPVFVHPHALKHGLAEEQILRAWGNFVAKRQRRTPNEDQTMCVGYAEGIANEIQMLAVSKPWGIMIYHAMSPAQDSVLDELGIPRRKWR